jgi:hypothetical protein
MKNKFDYFYNEDACYTIVFGVDTEQETIIQCCEKKTEAIRITKQLNKTLASEDNPVQPEQQKAGRDEKIPVKFTIMRDQAQGVVNICDSLEPKESHVAARDMSLMMARNYIEIYEYASLRSSVTMTGWPSNDEVNEKYMEFFRLFTHHVSMEKTFDWLRTRLAPVDMEKELNDAMICWAIPNEKHREPEDFARIGNFVTQFLKDRKGGSYE